MKDAVHGFCMALADSVPGVSGGTIAFIMGFYDRFITALNQMVFGNWKEKKKAGRYLVRLGAGWIIGMVAAVLVLTALFEQHIYMVSSLFIGFIAGSLPLILKEEKASFRNVYKGIWFALAGALFVVGITWMNGRMGTAAVDFSQFSLGLGIRLFIIGMIAICAMFLPGISGSTLLLIFGVYIPVITAVKKLLSLQLEYLPAVFFFGCGILAGAVTVVKGIKICLERFRTQMVYAIGGMMLGSFYAIIMGPTTFAIPQMPVSWQNFQPLAAIMGLLLVLGMYWIKKEGVSK